MANNQKNDGKEFGRLIPHPTLLRQQVLHSPSKASMLDVLNGVDASRNSGWSLKEVQSALEAAHWKPALADIDEFGAYLARFEVTFREARPEPSTAPSDRVKAVRDEFWKKVAEISLAKRSAIFASASRIASVVEDVLGPDNPIPIIEDHLRMLLEGADERSRSTKEALAEDSELFETLTFLGTLFATLWPREPRAQVINYWLASPFGEAAHELSARTLKKLSSLGSPYDALIFDRFAYPTNNLRLDGLDPPVRHWTEFTWALAFAKTPHEMARAVEALFQMRVQSEPDVEGHDEAAEDINAFFERVMETQEGNGGRSFWNADTTFVVGESFTWWWDIDSRKPVEIDLPSHFSYLVNEWDDSEPPPWKLWVQLIDRLLAYGHTRVAQAVVSYALLDEIIGPEPRISDWRSLVALVRRLREEPHFEVLAPSLRVLCTLLDARGERLLASRLDGYVQDQCQPSTAAIGTLLDFSGTVGPEELKMRLVEHIGQDNWEKFSQDAHTWLIEAEHNWRTWRFTKRGKEFERIDWSPIALQFLKAIEHELVSRYGEACKKHGHHDSAGRVALGNVVYFLKTAAGGDAQHQATLEKLGRRIPDVKLVKRLGGLNRDFRNRAAHPAPFPLETLDRLRRELFPNGLLREIADGLL